MLAVRPSPELFRLGRLVFVVPDTDYLVIHTILPSPSLAMSAARLLTRAVRPSAFARQPVRLNRLLSRLRREVVPNLALSHL